MHKIVWTICRWLKPGVKNWTDSWVALISVWLILHLSNTILQFIRMIFIYIIMITQSLKNFTFYIYKKPNWFEMRHGIDMLTNIHIRFSGANAKVKYTFYWGEWALTGATCLLLEDHNDADWWCLWCFYETRLPQTKLIIQNLCESN